MSERKRETWKKRNRKRERERERECVSHIGKSIPRERDILMMSEMEGETES